MKLQPLALETMNLAQATWSPGTQFSRYQILSRLARGGMAEVWRATATGVEGFRREVVIKTMRPELAVSPDLVRMFINEATIAARLNHPGIIHVFDFGQLDERYFIAMEYVPGLSLRQLGRALRDRRLRMPRRLVLRFASSVARTLAYAHAACEGGVPLGFVHRDVSPENIMVSSTGATKLIDFGAAMTHACPPPERMFVGKFRYLSPERLRGENGDARADIYALGIVLYECLTGRRPYDGNNVQDMLVAGPPADPSALVPNLPRRLGALVLRAIAVDVEARYQRAADLADDLADLVDGRLGRDPLGATDHQASIVLRQSENEGDELPDLAAAFDGERRPRQPSRTLRIAAAPPAVAPLVATSPTEPVRTSRVHGTSVAVVVSDANDSDEGTPIDSAFGLGADDEDSDAPPRPYPVADDDDTLETKLFMKRDPQPEGQVSSIPAASPGQEPPPATVSSKRRPSRQRSRAAGGSSSKDGEPDDEGDPKDKVGSKHGVSAADVDPPGYRRTHTLRPDPLVVVQRSLPELHGGAAWFVPTLSESASRPRRTAVDGHPSGASQLEDVGDAPLTTPASIRSVSAAACFERGLRLIAARDLEAALVEWRRASALDPERTWYRTNLERLVRHLESAG